MREGGRYISDRISGLLVGSPAGSQAPKNCQGGSAHGFGALAQYGSGDVVAAPGFLAALGEVSKGCDNADRPDRGLSRRSRLTSHLPAP